MSGPSLRAIVLAAGFGVRLRPLTLFVPKPLLPVDGVPIAGHTLRQLAELDCELSVLNLHHLPDQIRSFFGQSYFGMPLRYSHEEEIQGTAGALYGPRSLLRRADLVLILNGDSLSRWPLKQMIRHHLKTAADVTLLLHRRAPESALGGGIAVDASGRIVAMRDSEPVGEVKRRHVFAGAHLLSPAVLDQVAAGPGDIITDLYLPLLKQGRHLQSVVTRAAWHDLGTPKRYFDALQDDAVRDLRSRWKNRRVSRLAQIHPSAVIKHSSIEGDVEIGEGAQIERSLLLQGASIAAGCQLSECLIGPGVRLNGPINVERRMINRMPVGYQPGERETLMGDLVYTPLES